MKTTTKISAVLLSFGLALGISALATSAKADDAFAGPVMTQTQTKNQFDYSTANQTQNQLKQQNKNDSGEKKQYKKQYKKGKSH